MKQSCAYKEPWFYFVWAIAIVPIFCSVHLIDYALSYQDDAVVEGYVKRGMSLHLLKQAKPMLSDPPPVAYQVVLLSDQLHVRQLKGATDSKLGEVIFYQQGMKQPYQVAQLVSVGEGLYRADLVKPLQGFQQGIIVVYNQDKTWSLQQGFQVPFSPIIVESYAK
tara:strand:- start:1779 stop:2273 length:495 start_codon:yes stop_codon:yes gene_type:complete